MIEFDTYPLDLTFDGWTIQKPLNLPQVTMEKGTMFQSFGFPSLNRVFPIYAKGTISIICETENSIIELEYTDEWKKRVFKNIKYFFHSDRHFFYWHKDRIYPFKTSINILYENPSLSIVCENQQIILHKNNQPFILTIKPNQPLTIDSLTSSLLKDVPLKGAQPLELYKLLDRVYDDSQSDKFLFKSKSFHIFGYLNINNACQAINRKSFPRAVWLMEQKVPWTSKKYRDYCAKNVMISYVLKYL